MTVHLSAATATTQTYISDKSRMPPFRKKTQKRAHETTKTNVSGNHLSIVPAGPYTSTTRYPVAPRTRCTLRYSDYFNMGTGVPGIVTQVMNLNSLFDPDRTGTGHQPRGFDQLATFYSRYRVYGVSFKITYTVGGTTNDALVIMCYPRNGTGTPSNISDVAENPWGQYDQCSLYTKARVLKGFVNLAELNGKTAAAYKADDTTQALTSASPAEVQVMDITVQSLSGASITGYMSVLLEFDCEFSDPIALSQS